MREDSFKEAVKARQPRNIKEFAETSGGACSGQIMELAEIDVNEVLA